MDKKNIVRKVFGVLGAILFFLSYLPFVFVIYAGIIGVQRGLIGGAYIYGFEAMFNYLTWFCIIPIIPVCVIYQLVFGIIYIRKHKILTVATLIIVAGIIIASVSVGISFEVSKKNMIRHEEDAITEHLANKYGSEMAQNIVITVQDYEGYSYYVSTDVFPKGGKFVICPDDDYSDDLINEFELYNGSFHNDLTTYVDHLNDLPDNMSFSIVVESIDFGNYKDGDDYSVLFEKTTYRINGIMVDSDELTDDIVLDIINDVWNKYAGKFENEDYYNIYIKQSGKNAFSVTVFFRPDKSEATAKITTYSDYQGITDLRGAEIALDR